MPRMVRTNEAIKYLIVKSLTCGLSFCPVARRVCRFSIDDKCMINGKFTNNITSCPDIK
jgi:hypothetical protein